MDQFEGGIYNDYSGFQWVSEVLSETTVLGITLAPDTYSHIQLQRSMNRRILTGLAMAGMLYTAGTAAFAQSAGIGSSATIVTPITATATAPLDFGTIVKGSTATVEATSASAAAATFSGDESDNVIVTIPPTLDLETTSGDGASMTVKIDRSGLRANSTNAQRGTRRHDGPSRITGIPVVPPEHRYSRASA